MPTGAVALGSKFDVVPVFVPTDVVAGAATGLRINARRAGVVSFVLIGTAGSTDVLAVDLQEHTASSSGTTRDLDIITKYYYQEEATLDADETWTQGSQSAASEITALGSASTQILAVIEVRAEQLSDDCSWVSLNVPDLGTNGAKTVACIAILTDLYAHRLPTAYTAQLTALS